MAGLWDIVVPEATTNMVTNPSFETGTTGWLGLNGGTLARSTDDPLFGQHNLKVTPSANVYGGTYSWFSATNTVTYTCSIYFKGAVGIPYKLYLGNGSTHNSTDTTFTGDGAWHRYKVTYTAEATETLLIVIIKNNSANTAVFYLDGGQVEAKAYATTYCDGDQFGCSWDGVHHASISTRKVSPRAGGPISNLQDDYHFYCLHPTGIGAPPVTNYYTDYALLVGALHEHTKIHGRLFILNGLIKGTSLESLHTRRAALYNVLRPDQVSDQPVLIQYTGGAKTVQIAAYYDGGMEMGMVEGFVERLGIRFYAPDPEWLEITT